MFPTKRVLLAVKGDSVSEDAFHIASTLAKQDKGKVLAAYVIEVKRSLPIDAEIPIETTRSEKILSQIENLAKTSKCPVEANILQSRQAGPAIVQEAINKEVDLIVADIGNISVNIGDSISQMSSYILHNASCRVIFCHGQQSFVGSENEN